VELVFGEVPTAHSGRKTERKKTLCSASKRQKCVEGGGLPHTHIDTQQRRGPKTEGGETKNTRGKIGEYVRVSRDMERGGGGGGGGGGGCLSAPAERKSVMRDQSRQRTKAT